MATQQKAGQGDSRAAMEKTAENFPTLMNFGPNVDTLVKANAQAGRIWMESYNKIGRELMDFVSERWNRDVETMRRLSECRDPFQAFQVQADCMQTAMKQYMEEYAKLADMATDANVSAVQSLDEGMRNAQEETRQAMEETRGVFEEVKDEATKAESKESKDEASGQQKRKS